MRSPVDVNKAGLIHAVMW